MEPNHEQIENTRQQFAELTDDDATAVAGRMFQRAFVDIARLGCPLHCVFGGALRAVVTQAFELADAKPLAEWMRAVANDIEAEAEQRRGKPQ